MIVIDRSTQLKEFFHRAEELRILYGGPPGGINPFEMCFCNHYLYEHCLRGKFHLCAGNVLDGQGDIGCYCLRYEKRVIQDPVKYSQIFTRSIGEDGQQGLAQLWPPGSCREHEDPLVANNRDPKAQSWWDKIKQWFKGPLA